MEPKTKTFYGRRKGRALSKERAGILVEGMKEFAIGLGSRPRAVEAEDRKCLQFLFALGKKNTLEVGYGSGEHLIEYAKKRPDEFFVGTEVFENGNAAMVKALRDTGLTNVRIFPEDVNMLLPHLPGGVFDQIFILYPDPWPKARHESRRMISEERVKTFAGLLKPGGRMLVASDHPIYIPHVLRVVLGSGLFEWTAKNSRDFMVEPLDWETTRYEQKAKREGRTPIYLEFIKK